MCTSRLRIELRSQASDLRLEIRDTRFEI